MGRDDLPSLSYTIETAEVHTEKGTATTGRFTFLGETDRTVSDILRDSRLDPDTVGKRRNAAAFIADYLKNHGNEARAKEVIEAGEAEGYSAKTLKNARKKVAETRSTGNGKDKVHFWILRLGPAEGPVGPNVQRSGPTGPTTGPKADDDTQTDICSMCEVELVNEQSIAEGRCAECNVVLANTLDELDNLIDDDDDGCADEESVTPVTEPVDDGLFVTVVTDVTASRQPHGTNVCRECEKVVPALTDAGICVQCERFADQQAYLERIDRRRRSS